MNTSARARDALLESEHLVTATPIRFSAADGYSLGGRLWQAGVASPSRVAMINAGAGIVSRYYDRFAAHLAARGCPTVVYDYRGIGQSRPADLRGFSASVEEWGSKDCAAVLDWLAFRFSGAERLVIGHSVGGFLTGFAPNASLIDRMLLVCAHTGYWGDYAWRARAGMFLLWHAAMPLITKIVGYFPGKRLHLLEDLPAGVAMQWANRRRPDFWWNLRLDDGRPDSARIASLVECFCRVRARSLALAFTDDPFATREATNRIVSLYANSAVEVVYRGPQDVAGASIGHFGFFRSRFKTYLWPLVTNWLGQPPDGQIRPTGMGRPAGL